MSLHEYYSFVQAGLMSVGHAHLSTHIFKFFFLQLPLQQCPDGHNFTTNINVDEADNSVCPKMAHSLSVGHMLY